MSDITYYPEIVQGSDEWRKLRCGLLTASQMHRVITLAKLQPAKTDFIYEIVAQRISQYVEPEYISDDMMRGQDDEDEAAELYEKHFADGREVSRMGFIVRKFEGFRIGYSPDRLVGKTGLLEIKSRNQRLQIETIVNGVPLKDAIQIQTGMLVSGREWLDYVSYCGGLPLYVLTVLPDPIVQEAILKCAALFEKQADEMLNAYRKRISLRRSIETKRKVEEPMWL